MRCFSIFHEAAKKNSTRPPNLSTEFPVAQIDGQHFNLGTSMPCGSTASRRGSPFYSVNTDDPRAALRVRSGSPVTFFR
jgi:hypothetical protein